MCCRYSRLVLNIVVIVLIVTGGMFQSGSFLVMGADLNSSIDKYLEEKDSSDNGKDVKKDDRTSQDKKTKDSKEKQDINWRIEEAYFYTDKVMKVILSLSTSKDFSVFKEDLSFFLDSGSEPIKVVYPPSFKRQDPIKRVMKDSFKNGDKFEIYFIPMYESKKMMVKFSACTIGKCLFPTVEAVSLKCIEENFPSGLDIDSIKKDENYIQKVERSVSEISSEDTSGSLALNSDLINGLNFEGVSLWVFLLLFLAGILTNCTPCVAPMIPITVGIMVKNRRKFTSCFYSLGICLTYTLLGLISVLGGKMFGFLMYSTPMNLVFAIFMGVIAIGMLHDGSLVFVQNLFGKGANGVSKIKNEYLTSFVKGILAGGLAAPCTGPVLAALLTYIATSQNIYYGTSLMLVYSLGFSLPYLLLGMFSANLSKVRIPTKVQRSIKIIFASLMFALGFYYLRNIFYRSFENIWIYMLIVGTVVGGLSLYLYSRRKTPFYLSMVSFGLGCFLFFSYLGIGEVFKINLDWVYSEEEAVALSIKEEKPILLDNWANWCAYCSVAEKHLASNRDKISSYVLWKQDLSKDNSSTREHKNKYNLNSLPTFILIYPKEGGTIDGSLYDQGRIDVSNMEMKYFNDIHDLLEEVDRRNKE